MQFSRMFLGVCVAIAVGSCDDGAVDPPPTQLSESTLSVYLTDAPGDVAAVWVDIAEIYFQGGPGGHHTLLSEPTGLIELTSLADQSIEIVSGLALDPGTYSQLRFRLNAAVLEASDGSVYAFGGATHPGGLEVTGALQCPNCSVLKVKLSSDEVAVGEGRTGLVLDFDVAQSFAQSAGSSGNWTMQPVVHGVKGKKGNPGAGSKIAGSVTLGTDIAGAPVTIPACPVGTNRSIKDFVPIATAGTLVDDSGAAIVRTGTVKKKGTFSMRSLAPDSYTLGFRSELELGSARLAFEATVSPETADLTAGADVSGVAYEITSAVCVEGPVTPPTGDTLWVATDGSDETGDGSDVAPFATITGAMDAAEDGALVLVRPGLYEGIQFLRGSFEEGVTVRSEVPYRAQLRNAGNRAVGFYTFGEAVAGITLEGFDIAHSGTGAPLVMHIDGNGTRAVSRITIRNNVIHDSYDNDLLKVNNSAVDIVIEGNMFYNQVGPDEHIDVNSTEGVIVQDNVFFNDFEGSGRTNPANTGSFIVIKDSNAAEDVYLGSLDTVVRRNVFLNYQGGTGYTFVLAGEDGNPFHEAIGVLVENNLMLGNSTEIMRAAVGVKGAKDVTFRNNTISGDMPSLAFALRVRTEGQNPPNENINFYNNLWSDPTGTMGAQFQGDLNDFSDSPPAQTLSFSMANNLYWNGGAAIPSDSRELINYTDDLTGIIGDPQLSDPANVVVPRWDPSSGLFADGSQTIREVFVRLVDQYGTPATGSAAFGAADPTNSPSDDILGRLRTNVGVDVGAVQR